MLDRSPWVVEEIQSLEDKLRDEEPKDGKREWNQTGTK